MAKGKKQKIARKRKENLQAAKRAKGTKKASKPEKRQTVAATLGREGKVFSKGE